MSPDQCREARAILKWTRRELADAAGVTLWVVAAFEDGRDILAHYEIGIRAALEAVGIGFPFTIEDGQFKVASTRRRSPKKETARRCIRDGRLVGVGSKPSPSRFAPTVSGMGGQWTFGSAEPTTRLRQ